MTENETSKININEIEDIVTVFKSRESFNEFLSIDDDLVTFDNNASNEVESIENDIESNDNSSIAMPKITEIEALDSLSTLKKFCSENSTFCHFNNELLQIEKDISDHYIKRKAKQAKITDYFKKI